MSLHNDPNWLRAGNWFSTSGTDADIAILGVGASKSAITPNKAYETPAAIRDALFKYSTYRYRCLRSLCRASCTCCSSWRIKC